MKYSCTFVAIVACAMNCGFVTLGADETPATTPSPSKESSFKLDEKNEETVPRKYLGFADVSEFRGVIDDPDGYVNLRKAKGTDAPVLTKVKAGEPFLFKKNQGEDWCEVKLKSGVTGWMHCSRIKLYFTKDDLPQKSEQDEIEEQARRQGVNYFEITQAAARGDEKALKTFFGLDADGAAAEEHDGVSSVVVHLLGDDAFAKFLDEQPVSFWEGMSSAWDAWPFDTKTYFRQHFPKSAKLLLSDNDQLIREYTRAIKMNPKDSHAYRKRGVIESEKEEWDRAVADFSRAIELNSKDHHAFYDRGVAHIEKGEYDAAVKDIQKAIDLNGNRGGYYLELGSCQLFNRKPREAIAAALRALELSPDNAAMIRTVLAHGYLFDNQFDKAKAIYLENKDAKLRYGQGTFSEDVLDDFKQFRDAGLTHPDMEKIDALLTSTTQDTNSTNPQ